MASVKFGPRHRLTFGKFRGETIKDVVEKQKSWCKWLINEPFDPMYEDTEDEKASVAAYYAQFYGPGDSATKSMKDASDRSSDYKDELLKKIDELNNNSDILDGNDILPELDKEQMLAATRFLHEKTNIFVTGSAGTGKSLIIKYIKQNSRNTTLVAPTWSVAANIGGESIHRCFRIKPGIENTIKWSDPEETIISPDWSKEFWENREKERRERYGFGSEYDKFGYFDKTFSQNMIRQLQKSGLIIDEVSMLTGRMVDLLDCILRHDIDENKPF
jgi:hypothetical protein